MKPSFSTIFIGDLPDTPFGHFRIATCDLGLLSVEWLESRNEQENYLKRFRQPKEENQRKIQPFASQLDEFLNGKRLAFKFDIHWGVFTPFQRKALQAVCRIPYGETRTYVDIARQIGHPNAYRAVGGANAMNPMPIVVPCHRLIGKDGKLHGYGGYGGLKMKERLLELENRDW